MPVQSKIDQDTASVNWAEELDVRTPSFTSNQPYLITLSRPSLLARKHPFSIATPSPPSSTASYTMPSAPMDTPPVFHLSRGSNRLSRWKIQRV